MATIGPAASPTIRPSLSVNLLTWTAVNRLNYRFHRPLGFRHARISAIAVNLVARVFGLRTLAGDHDSAALSVYLDGMLVGSFERQEKQRPQHFDHVIIGVTVSYTHLRAHE